MSDKKDTPHDSSSTKHGIADILKATPLISQSDEENSKKKDQKESGDFDHEDIQKQMNGVINNLQSDSSDQIHKTPTKTDSHRPKSPLVGEQAGKSTHVTSPQLSKKDTNVLVIDDKKSKPRKKSSSSRSSSSDDDQHKKKKGHKGDSSDNEHHPKSNKPIKQEPSQQKHDSSQTKHDSTVSTSGHKHSRHSSTDTNDLPRSTTKQHQGQQSHGKQSPRDNKKRSPSRESHEERLNNSKVSQHDKPKTKPSHSTDKEHSDDEFYGFELPKKTTNDEHDKKKHEDNNLKKTHSVEHLVSSFIRPSADPHSDAEQTKPKRRRPKRISRTTQTHEYIFRRMEREEHQELLPTNDMDKNIQTRQSTLCPTKRSSTKPYSIYLSSDEYKIEHIKPKKSSSDQRDQSHTRRSAPQTGKLLILRPTLPGHKSKSVNVQRVSLEYAIDLMRNDNHHDSSPAAQRHKSNTRKQPERSQKPLYMNSGSSSKGLGHKDKPYPKDDHTNRRTPDWTF